MVITDESNCKSKSIPNNSNSLISNSLSVSRDTSKNSISKLNSSLNPISYSELKSKLPKVLMEFLDVFSESSANELPPHRQYDCQINIIANGKLHYGPIYPLTDKEIKALEKYIKENLKKGFIRKSKSPAGASIFFVLKKNGELRLVVDYRSLNEITIRDSYPLPLIQDMLEHLGKAKIFSKLDLRSAYNLIRIKEGDEYKTAFTCIFGHFEYTVMPFGLKNAPAVFQHFINDVLEDVIEKFEYAYIDDIIIFSKDYNSHIKHVKEILIRLKKCKLKYAMTLLLQVIMALKKLFLLLFVIFGGLFYPLISRNLFNPSIYIVSLKLHAINLIVFLILLKLVNVLALLF